MKIVIVKEHWANLILDGEKTWEIRGKNTRIRGEIGIAISGTGKVFGTCVVESSQKITLEDFQENGDKHCVYDKEVINSYKQSYAWGLRNAVRFKEPIPYKHKQGAVVWVNDENIDLEASMNDKCIFSEKIIDRINHYIAKKGIYESSHVVEGMEYILVEYTSEIHEILLDSGMSESDIEGLTSRDGKQVIDLASANFEWEWFDGKLFHQEPLQEN